MPIATLLYYILVEVLKLVVFSYSSFLIERAAPKMMPLNLASGNVPETYSKIVLYRKIFSSFTLWFALEKSFNSSHSVSLHIIVHYVTGLINFKINLNLMQYDPSNDWHQLYIVITSAIWVLWKSSKLCLTGKVRFCGKYLKFGLTAIVYM